MRQRTAVLVVVAVALAAVTAPLAAATGTALANVDDAASAPAVAAASDGGTGNGSESIAPGQRLSGVVGAQRAEVEGEIETRSFGVRVSDAASPHDKAGVVAGQVNVLEARLDQLRNRKAALERAHQNGNMSDGEYRARVTEVVARIEATQRLINATSNVATDLPEKELKSVGVRRAAIAHLRDRVRNLSTPKTVQLAQTVVGESDRGVGEPSASAVPGLDDRRGQNRSTAGDDVPGRGRDGPSRSGGTNATATVNASAGVGANGSVGANGNRANGSVGANGTGVSGGVHVGEDGVSVDGDVNTTETDSAETTTGDDPTTTTDTETSWLDGIAGDETSTPADETTADETSTPADETQTAS